MNELEEKKWKLNYRILGKRSLNVSGMPGSTGHGPTSQGVLTQADVPVDMVDIEWTHTDGFPPDTIELGMKFKDVTMIVDCLLMDAVRQGIIDSKTKDKILVRKDVVFPRHEREEGTCIATVPVNQRTKIMDQINVRQGTPNSVVMLMLEEKRLILAKSLNVEP